MSRRAKLYQVYVETEGVYSGNDLNGPTFSTVVNNLGVFEACSHKKAARKAVESRGVYTREGRYFARPVTSKRQADWQAIYEPDLIYRDPDTRVFVAYTDLHEEERE